MLAAVARAGNEHCQAGCNLYCSLRASSTVARAAYAVFRDEDWWCYFRAALSKIVLPNSPVGVSRMRLNCAGIVPRNISRRVLPVALRICCAPEVAIGATLRVVFDS